MTFRNVVLTFSILFLVVSFSFGSSNHISTEEPNEPVSLDSSLQIEQITNLEYPHVAMVKPVFTATAYSSYYSYYSCRSSGSCDEKDGKEYLTAPLVDKWSTSSGAVNFISELKDDGYPDHKISIISDVTVHNNQLYGEDGQPKYDSLVFFHNEYVTMNEYHNMVNFIKAGGNVIILNGNAFFVEIDYDPVTDLVHLVDGHAYTYDGENGTRAYYYRYIAEQNSFEHFENFGSRYCAFNLGSTNGAIFENKSSNPHPIASVMVEQGISTMAPNYDSHEENCVITSNHHTIANWDTSFKQKARGIKIYEIFPHGPIGGSLIHFGFFGTDILSTSTSSRKTFVTAVRHQANYYDQPWIRYPIDGSHHNDPVQIDFTNGWNTTIYLDSVLSPSLERLDFIKPSEGQHNLTVVFTRGDQEIIRSVLFTMDFTTPQIDMPIDQNVPASDVYFNISDENPEKIFTAYWQEGKRIGLTGEEYSNKPMNGLNFSDTIERFDNGTLNIRIEVIDAAGNSNTSWFYYDINEKSIRYNVSQLQLQRTSFSELTVSIDKVSSDTDDVLTPYLQIMEDFSFEWKNIKMKTNSTHHYLKLNKTTQSFWYRISLHINGSWAQYFRSVRSFYWSNDVVEIDQFNVSLKEDEFTYNISLGSESIPPRNYSILLENNGKVYRQITNNNSLSNEFIGSVSGVEEGTYKVIFQAKSSQGYQYYTDMVSNQKTLDYREYYISGMKESETTLKINKSVLNLINSDYVKISINSGWNRIIKPSGISDIIFNSSQSLDKLEINYYLDDGKLIGKAVFEHNDPNPTLPSILVESAPDQIPHGDSVLVEWVIENGEFGEYDILLDNILVESDYFTSSYISYLFTGTGTGIRNLTLVIETHNGTASNSLSIEVLDPLDTTTTSNPTTSTTTTEVQSTTTSSSTSSSLPNSRSSSRTTDDRRLSLANFSMLVLFSVIIGRMLLKKLR